MEYFGTQCCVSQIVFLLFGIIRGVARQQNACSGATKWLWKVKLPFSTKLAIDLIILMSCNPLPRLALPIAIITIGY